MVRHLLKTFNYNRHVCLDLTRSHNTKLRANAIRLQKKKSFQVANSSCMFRKSCQMLVNMKIYYNILNTSIVRNRFYIRHDRPIKKKKNKVNTFRIVYKLVNPIVDLRVTSIMLFLHKFKTCVHQVFESCDKNTPKIYGSRQLFLQKNALKRQLY